VSLKINTRHTLSFLSCHRAGPVSPLPRAETFPPPLPLPKTLGKAGTRVRAVCKEILLPPRSSLLPPLFFLLLLSWRGDARERGAASLAERSPRRVRHPASRGWSARMPTYCARGVVVLLRAFLQTGSAPSPRKRVCRRPSHPGDTYSTSPRNRNRILNRNHLETCLSSKKNWNSLAWVLPIFSVKNRGAFARAGPRASVDARPQSADSAQSGRDGEAHPHSPTHRRRAAKALCYNEMKAGGRGSAGAAPLLSSSSRSALVLKEVT
jgi:hypothetical protein